MEPSCEFGIIGCQFRNVSVVGCWRMLTEPHFHQGHKNTITRDKRLIKIVRLSLPLISQLARYFFDKGGKLIELLFCIVVGEEVEVRVIKDLAFFGPYAIG